MKLKDGREIAIRKPRKGDERKMLAYINSLIKERVYILAEKKKTLADEKKFLDGLLKEMKAGKKIALVFECGGRIVAVIEAWKGSHEKNSHVCELALALSKDFRGAGLGNIIMKMLIDASRKKLKCKVARLSVFSSNKRAIRLYMKHGFRETGRIPKGIRHFGKYCDEIIMVKEL